MSKIEPFFNPKSTSALFLVEGNFYRFERMWDSEVELFNSFIDKTVTLFIEPREHDHETDLQSDINDQIEKKKYTLKSW